jgi:type IV pilus assembly protein PilC
MITYTYKLVTKENSILEGAAKTFFKSAIVKSLEKEGSTVLFIKRKEIDFLKMEIPFLSREFPAQEKIAFYRNFSSMLSSGMSMILILDTVAEQLKSNRMKKVLADMAHEVKNGTTLSSAMEKRPKHFPPHVVETVRVGELGGILGEVLDRIANDFERNYELRKKVTGAVAYPAVVITVMIIVMIGLIVLVLPQIAELFSSIGAEPPFLTKALLSLSFAFRTHPILILSTFIAIIAAIVAVFKNEKGKYFFHKVFLKLPVFGTLIKEFNITLFFRSLESLFSSGVSLVQATDVSRKTLKNKVYEKAVGSTYPLLVHGSSLSEVLKPYPELFPSQIQKMVSVGEKAGRLQDTFERIVKHYERSVNYRTAMMTTLLEPILMVIVGVAVGALALSIFLPIYQVASLI